MRPLLARIAAVSLVCAALCAPGAASAQVHLLVEAGLSHPIGPFSDVAASGYHGGIGLQAGAPLFPLSFRVEGGADRFNGSGSTADHITVLSGSASAVLSLGGLGVSPYLLGGVGEYRTSYGGTAPAQGSWNGAGYHLGAGLSFGALGFGGFVEVRFVNANGTGGRKTRFIPIMVGLRL
jgi:hypothetical protein